MTSLLDVRAAMEARLDEYPSDWDTRLVLADLLEELDEPTLAVGQRWQVVKRKWPYRPGFGPFGWFDVLHFGGSVDPQSDLPSALFAHLPPDAAVTNERDVGAYWCHTRAAAEEALAHALAHAGRGSDIQRFSHTSLREVCDD